MKEIRIGTRGSQLALWQAEHIAARLQNAGLKPEIVVIDTKCDKVLDVAIAKIGGKGVFTEELEDKLRSGEIDIAVHSAKDLPSRLDEEFEIIAFTKREKANDVLVSRKKDVSLRQSIKVGTSSTRRIATLRHYFPGVSTVEMRGNLQTRIRKMDEGVCDALILAYAGIYRMGYSGLIAEELPLDVFTPAVGQASLAIEASKAISKAVKASIRDAVNDQDTEYLILAERAYLRVLEGGCSIPAFALAHELDNDNLSISAGILSLDGTQKVAKQLTGKKTDAKTLGEKIAGMVLSDGGEELLREIKRELQK